MKKVIWKYKLADNILLPIGAEILTAQLQGNDLVLWALVDPIAKSEMRSFQYFATGEDISEPERYKYIATIATYQKGWFVGHVFERIK